jgi:hypothetical protein
VPTPPADLVTDGKLRVNRIVLFPYGASSTPLVADVLPTYHVLQTVPRRKDSGIEITDSGRKAKINFAVRSVFYRKESLIDTLRREAVVFEIELDTGAGPDKDYKSFTSDDLDDDELIDDFDRGLAEVLSEDIWRPLETSDDRVKISDALGIQLRPATQPQLKFSKAKRWDEQKQIEVEQDFYAVEFRAELFNRERSNAQLLRGFNQSFVANRLNRGRVEDHEDFPDADELIVFEEGEPRPSQMRGRQLASYELNREPPTKVRSSWVVIIEDTPVGSAVALLGNKALKVWNEVARNFHGSLRNVRAGNKVSFLPSFDTSPTCPASRTRWALGYHLRDALDAADPSYAVEGNKDCDPCRTEKKDEDECEEPAQRAEAVKKCAKYTAFSVWPLEKTELCAVFPGVFDEGRENLSTLITIGPVVEGRALSFQKRPWLRLDIEQIGFASERAVRLGAIDLRLGQKQDIEAPGGFFEIRSERRLPKGQSFDDERFEIPPVGSNAPTTPPEARRLNVQVMAFVNVAQVLPGGEDPPASDEFIPQSDLSLNSPDPAFRRDPPILLPWGRQGNKNGLLFLLIREKSDDEHTHSLAIELKNKKLREAEEEQRLVVVDPDPFSIVAVKFPPFDSQGVVGGQGTTNPSNTIGFWVNGPNGQRWQLQSLSDEFSLVMPPQVVGEEMEKHRTVVPNSPVNFRFAQPTTLKLSQSEFRQNFREPPWNLRRILEPESAQASGAKVVFMQYELLYGLSCSFRSSETNVKNLRLLEIFKRFGRIPRRIPSDEPSARPAAEAWSQLFRQYRARIGVFMPWEPSNERSLILNEGIQCTIRRPGTTGDGANWAHPIDTEDFETPTPHNYQDLRGGATWGFESRNVFNAVTRANPTTGKIESDSARLIDPEFSSLGGWGNVKATFDNQRSAIYGDAAMGRTFSYTLERIGRIACFWNKAKHVIVYERHVAPSTQFVCTQGTPDHRDDLTGLPLLRKTHEYVEILEDRRTYPENPLAPAMQRGFVTGCYFTKGQRINVDSLWGGDVEQHGWKVPLWNPTARRDVYPKPIFSIGVESDVAGREADSQCQCDNPENVFFYTSTDPNLTADTDRWPAVLDVDYVNLPLPQPSENDYPGGNLLPVFPADPPIAPGFSICTFRVAKPTSPINLVAQRAEKPLSTVLQNVTMMRAGVRQAASNTLENLTQLDDFSKLHALGREAVNVYASVFQRLPETAHEGVTQVRERLSAAVAVESGRINNLHQAATAVKSRIESVAARFVDRVIERENQILDTMGGRLKGFIDELRKEYRSVLDRLAQLAATSTPAQFDRIARDAVDRIFQKAVDTLFMVPLSSNILRRAVGPFGEAAANLRGRYLRRLDDLKLAVEGMTTIGAAERQRIREMVGLADVEIRSLIQSLRNIQETFRGQQPEPWMPDPQQLLMQLRQKLQSALSALDGYQQSLDALLGAVTAAGKAVILARIADLRQLATNDPFKRPIEEVIQLVGEKDQIRDEIRRKLITWIATSAAAEPPHVVSEAGCSASPGSAYCEVKTRVNAALAAAADVNGKLSRLRDIASAFDNLLSERAVDERVREFKAVIETHRAEIMSLATSYTAHLASEAQRLMERFNLVRLQQEVVGAVQSVASAFEDLSRARRDLQNHINQIYEDNYKSFQEATSPVFQSADAAVKLVRAFGSPPAVPNLAFDRPEVAFFYKETQRFVDVTPVLARVNQAQQAADALKALGVRLPTKQLLEDLVPQPLENFDLRKIFPDFAGLKLENLLPGLKMPSIANDRVRISQGVDPQTRRAWVQAVVDDVRITTPSTLFAIGPVELSVPKSSFTALTRFEAAVGEPPKRKINAKIKGDWDVKIGGQSMIVFRDTELSFDDAEGLKFRIDPSRMQLNGILTFVSDLLKKFGGNDSGLSFGLLPDGGIQCVLKLPLPPVQFGAFGISNLNLGAVLALRLNDPLMDGFSIELGFNLGRKLAPFSLTVFLLGGGGYLEVSTRYAPGNGRLRCFVSLGITVSASLAIALGPIHGGVYIYFGITAEFQAGGGAKFAIGVMLLMRGEVSLLGIVSACISLLLEAQYDTTSGQIIGHGQLSISIKICWCFTLEISEDITYTVGEGNQGVAMMTGEGAHGLALMSPATPGPAPTYVGLVEDYVNMLA